MWLCAALCSPSGVAKTFTSFTEQETFAQGATGNFYNEHLVSPGAGIVQVYAHAALGGAVDSVARIGALYSTNTGDLLEPFTAVTKTSGTVAGTINCVNFDGGTLGSLSLELQQWRLQNGAWVLVDAFPVRSWSCPLVSTVVIDTFASDTPFIYEPGASYRVMLEVRARARASDTSQATVDFCESGTVRCGVSPEHVLLQEITVPNQAPFTRFQDQSFWYVTAIEDGVHVTGRACDIDGTTLQVTVQILGFPGQTTTPIGAVCGSGTHFFKPLAPGFYTGVAEGLDNEGAKRQDVGECRITVFPVGSPPVGFPDLAQFNPTSSFAIETLLASDSSVTASRVTVDGTVVSDTLGSTVPPVGASLASISYDLATDHASVVVDGIQRWSGPVVPEADPVGWWDIRPV